jgi:AcrR family transcriptional regulator
VDQRPSTPADLLFPRDALDKEARRSFNTSGFRTGGLLVPEVLVAVRLTRAERKEQIRADLIASAEQVFRRRGFHQASLEEIATEAGWSKGAVFSNFTGKDDLFLAVVEDRNRRSQADQTKQMRARRTLAGSLRAASGEIADVMLRDPHWTPLLIEFWTHASRNEQLRSRVSAAHEQLLEGYALLIDGLAARDGLEFVVPAKEVARSAASLARGLAIERLLDPTSVPEGRLEELFTAHVLSFTRLRTGPV